MDEQLATQPADQIIAERLHQTFFNTLKPASAIFSALIFIIAIVFYFFFPLQTEGLLFFGVALIYIAINIGIRLRTPSFNLLSALTIIMLVIPVTLLYAYFYTTEVYRTLIYVCAVVFAGSFYVLNKRAFQISVAIFAIEYIVIIIALGGRDEPIRAAIGLFSVFVVTLFLNNDYVNNLHRIERFRVRDELAQQKLKEEIAERQQAQKALAASYESVEQQVQKRTEELNQALQREQFLFARLEETLEQETQLQQMKTDIIATVSHEFRTPLNIISMSTDVLMDHHDRLSPEKRSKYRSNIKSQIFYITDMLQDVFFINHAEAIVLKQEPFAFDMLCQRLENDLRLAVAGATTNLDFTYPQSNKQVVTDYTHLQRLIMNLLSNAIKFSEADQLVEVEWGVVDKQFLIVVRDSGIGIPLEDQDRIFDIFYRGSNIETRRGLGLGLSIVKTIVTAFNGTIRVESVGHGHGATFFVLL